MGGLLIVLDKGATMDFIDKIICGDCLDVMAEIPEKSIPLIIADPPYNIGKAAWDKIDNYLDWCGEWIKACERVLMDNGSMYVFHNDMPFIAKLMGWIEGNTGLVFKQLVTWGKVLSLGGFATQRLSVEQSRNYNGGFTEYVLFYTFQDETGLSRIYEDRDCFRGIKEYMKAERKKANAAGYDDKRMRTICGVSLKGGGLISHFWVDSQWMFPTAEMYAKLQGTGYFQRPYEELRMEYEELRYTFNTPWVLANLYGNSNTWFYAPTGNPDHPTQKPVDLIANIILHSSNAGDLILDPFMGSGSTAIATIRIGRHYVGIEKDEGYCAIARERIRIENSQLKLDFGGQDD